MDKKERINKKHVGSTFDSFLKEEGIYEEVTKLAKAKVKKLKRKRKKV